VTGPHAADFLVGSSTCARPVAPSATCAVSVRFSPSATGPRTASLELPSDDPAMPLVIALGGDGVAPEPPSPAPAPAPTPATTPVIDRPAISGLRLTPARFRAATSGASLAATATGTTVTYSDPAAGATATFTILRKAPGVRRGATCVAAPAKRQAGVRSCTRLVPIGAFTRQDRAGANTFRFTGRVRTGGRVRALSAGRYVLEAAAKLGSRSSTTVQVPFTITR
jgi:hypothetical protein